MYFEWDAFKAASNLPKHGVSFDLAITIFDDPYGLRVHDSKHSNQTEDRYWQIGKSDSYILVVVFTIRMRTTGEVYRLISARKANRRERSVYEISKRIPF